MIDMPRGPLYLHKKVVDRLASLASINPQTSLSMTGGRGHDSDDAYWLMQMGLEPTEF